MNEPTHLDIFSGIGGFTLAAREAGFKTVGFCEIEPFCQQVLRQNFGSHIPIIADIRKLDGRDFRGVTLITGGFPCQPFSVAGKRQGVTDDRYIWPEMLRVIKEARPTWVVIENSPRVLEVVFTQIKSDLEGASYEVGEPLILPACAIGADHKRARAWICAHINESGLQGSGQEALSRESALPEQSAGVFEIERSRRCLSQPEMLRSLNGISHGVDRIKGLGNAIVPQVAYEILREIRKLM